MKKLVALLFPILILSSCCCKKSKTSCNKDKANCCKTATTPEAIEAALPGEWVWFKTYCCGRTSTWHTPVTDSSSASLTFSKDKKVEHFKNGKSEYATSYTVSYFDEGSKSKIAYDEVNGRKAMIRLSNDTLVIDYGYMDLQTEYYVRKK